MANVTRRGVVEILVSDHARERARERCPGFKAARIVDEVRAAIREGRLSPDQPAWVHGYSSPFHLYAWTPDQVRCYPLKVTDYCFVVVTTLVDGKA